LKQIELHAHLTGSVRDTTILELLQKDSRRKSANSNYSVEQSELNLLNELKRYPTGPRDLSACFEVFGILHRVLNSKAVLARVTREILDDFSRENVVYLELRTTPRDMVSGESKEVVLSKREYLETVIAVVQDFEKTSEMVVRLLLSVDRSKTIADGLDTVELCREFFEATSHRHVVGIDFSGNPKVKTFREMKPIFELAARYNLKVTVHIAEHWEDPDLEFILKEVRPGRIGHAVCLTPEWIEFLLENPLPIEICPTSNLITRCVDSIEQHPFYEFYKVDKSYPLTICTDDFGVFRTSLTNEYALIADAFNLSLNEMYELSRKSIGHIFDKSERVVDLLNRSFDQFSKFNLLDRD
jgi:adenosine deaminase